MQFLTSLIGGSGNTILNAVLALGVVLILVFLALWALKMVFAASAEMGRGRNRRLSVVDTLSLDGKRQLVIVRRDNVEHLILTGGSQDVVIESGIASEAPVAVARPPLAVRRPVAAAPALPRAPQRAPAPQRATIPEAPSPPPNGDDASKNPLDRLRDLGRTAEQRRAPSLRHTGLLRPVSRMEPGLVPANTDNSVRPVGDSATTARVTPFGAPRDGNGQANGDDDSNGGNREGGH